MYDKRENRGIRFLTGGGVMVIGILLVSLSATYAIAQGKKAEISESALQSALQRGLPGSVAAHTGTGTPTVREQGMASGSPALSVDMSELPKATNFESGEGHDRPLSGLSEEGYQALKRLVAKRAEAGEIGSAPSAHRAGKPDGKLPPPSLGGTSGFVAQSEVCCDPPDMSLAVGPTYVLQMVNNYIAVYNKNGTLQSGFPKSADTFFGLPSGTYTTDPRAFYDWDSGRYFVLDLTETNNGNPNGSP